MKLRKKLKDLTGGQCFVIPGRRKIHVYILEQPYLSRKETRVFQLSQSRCRLTGQITLGYVKQVRIAPNTVVSIVLEPAVM